MPGPGYYGVVSEDFAKVLDLERPADQWRPAGISHAVAFGTFTTLCGQSLEPFYAFYEHSFAEDGLNRCTTCAQLAK